MDINVGTGKYDVTTFQYPIDLNDDKYGGNKAVFYINTSKSSKFQPSTDSTVNLNATNVTRIRGDAVGKLFSSGTSMVGAINVIGGGISGLTAGALKGIASKIKGDAINNTGIAVTAIKGAGAGTIAGLAASAVSVFGTKEAASISNTVSREYVRLNTAISLHMPNNLNIKYSSNWSDTETSQLHMVGAALGLTKSVSENNKSNITDTWATIAANIGLSHDKYGGTISNATGLAANPRREMVFKGIDFRTFRFDYTFFPKSQEESEKVHNIIQTFKFHMHPEYKDANSFLYVYPSEFDISYYSGEGENANIHRHTSCVLVDMELNYTPNGNYNNLANGMPSQINMGLTFKELALMSKELISKGM